MKRSAARTGQIGRIAAAIAAVWLGIGVGGAALARTPDAGLRPLEPLDVFELERASDPRISPDGERIVYVRRGFDVLTDRATSHLWIVKTDGSGHQALGVGGASASQPRWSPSGDRVAFFAEDGDGRRQVFVHWLGSGRTAAVSRLTEAPSDLAWSPDGSMLAFTMFVAGEDPSPASLPAPPREADWGPPIEVIDRVNHRLDGRGELPVGHRHVFVIPADGGTARQITAGDFDHNGPLAWTPDASAIVVSANRREDRDFEPLDSALWRVGVAEHGLTRLTERYGPEDQPAVSPDGSQIAYVGFDDRHQGYQVEALYVANGDGSDPRRITSELDRDVSSPIWSADGDRILFEYDDEGVTRIGAVRADGGEVDELAAGVGGMSLGRPYGGGSFTVSDGGAIAFTVGTAQRPADIAVLEPGGAPRPVTAVNEDLLGHRDLGEVESLWYDAPDGERVQGWLVTPPGFDPDRTYPLILEIHGGPFANYGPRFAAEIQLMAAAGYVVLYTNPRGSTSYGEAFGNLIHHAYPGGDHDDLMAGVDAVLERGFVDPERLFITGGSGGGVLTAWAVGKTDRFRAAAVQKPVINWYSFVLYADVPAFFYKYWFPGPPWEHHEHYMDRSPISLVGEVTTPTMLITGSRDLRTPMAESEQYYHALQIRGVPTRLVRVPDAAHGIAARPSNLIAKVAHILAWFEEHGRAQHD